MDMYLLAMSLSQTATNRELHSALPNAPVVPDRAPRSHRLHAPHAIRTRATVAHLLERTARWVAPKPSCTPLH